MFRYFLKFLFVSASIACSSTFRGQDVVESKLTLGVTSKPTGDGQVEVGVRFDSTVPIGAVQMDLVFDPKQVRFGEVAAGADLKSALIESRLKDDGSLAVAFVSNAGAVGRGEMLRLGFSVIDPAAVGDGFVIENARGWTLDSGAEVSVTIETPPTKSSDVKERQASKVPTPQIEYRLPPWAYAVGGVGATTIFFLLVMLVRAETKTR